MKSDSTDRRYFLKSAAAFGALGSQLAYGQQPQSEFAPVYGDGVKRLWKVGLTLAAPAGFCANVYFTANVPANWKSEQIVKVANEQFTRHVGQYKYRDGLNGLKQMLVFMPQVPTRHTAMAHVTFEVERKTVTAPPNKASLRVTSNMPRDARFFLGMSPLIENRNALLLKKANEITVHAENDWQRVELIYDWVRENITYQNGPRKGALATFRAGFGEKEDLTSLFIAFCRNLKIPARTVWVPEHNYAEFYLQAPDGQGYWFPCELSGRRQFGEMNDNRPMLLRGDNFKVPEKPEPQRYVAEHLKVKGGSKPQVHFIREYVQA
ncbi:MAG: transglutaminase-like domain-containing protein [Planctomycetota bacterium]|nr:transglutaminase-like domain-containing protein [Planctomycetota bacterium]